MDKKIWILLFVAFVDMLGFGLVVPIFPLLIKDLGGSPFIIGLAIAVYSLFQFISSPILGRLSDKYGRKPILIISSLVNALSYLMLIFSTDIIHIFLARVLGGIASGNLSVGQAYIADVSKSHERTKLMALFGSLFGIGFAIGPLLGGILSNISYNAPFVLTFILAFFNAILIVLFLSESNTALKHHIKIELFNAKVMKEVIQPQNMKFLFILFFLINFAAALTYGVFPIYSNQVFGWGQREIGYYFGLGGLVAFFSQGFLVRYLLKKLNENILITYGIALTGLGLLLTGITSNIIILILSTVSFNIGASLVFPNIQGLASIESQNQEQGLVMGTLQSFGSFARITGPLLGGLIASYRVNLPYLISALFLLFIFIWGNRYLKNSR